MVINTRHKTNKMIVETSFICPVCRVEVANRLRKESNEIEPEYITCYRCKFKTQYSQSGDKYRSIPTKQVKP